MWGYPGGDVQRAHWEIRADETVLQGQWSEREDWGVPGRASATSVFKEAYQ